MEGGERAGGATSFRRRPNNVCSGSPTVLWRPCTQKAIQPGEALVPMTTATKHNQPEIVPATEASHTFHGRSRTSPAPRNAVLHLLAPPARPPSPNTAQGCNPLSLAIDAVSPASEHSA